MALWAADDSAPAESKPPAMLLPAPPPPAFPDCAVCGEVPLVDGGGGGAAGGGGGGGGDPGRAAEGANMSSENASLDPRTV